MRKLLRFRLKTFLLFVLVAAIACGYLSQQKVIYDQEQAAIRQLKSSVVGLKVEPAENFVLPELVVFWSTSYSNVVVYYEAKSKLGKFAKQTLGVNFFDRVTKIKVENQADFSASDIDAFQALEGIFVATHMVDRVRPLISPTRIVSVEKRNNFSSEFVLK